MTERRPPASKRPVAKRATSTRPVPRPKRPTKRRSALWRWRRGLFVFGLVGVAATGGVASVVFNIDLPPERALLQTSFVCAADVTTACGPDNAIATFSSEEDRIYVQLEEIPQVMVDAVLATEDRDFFEHGGVDPVGIGRALYNDLRGRGVQQGGSTITQQYVKNVYLTSERSIARKIKEAVLAVKLERELDKEEILERYLNTIYFGRGAYGVGAASRAYFGKDIRDVELADAAYMAGLIRAPEAADAVSDPVEATRRRSTALTAMASEGYITGEERDAAAALPWDAEHITPRRDRTGLGPVEGSEFGTKYFVEAVRQQIAKKYGEDKLYGGGLRIYTTLDMDMQQDAWEAVTSVLNKPEDPAAALVAVDDRGQVKAMIGGRDFDTNELNLAMGRDGGGLGRGAGSSFKPFALAAAVQQNISLNSKFNAPSSLTLPKANDGKDWIVRNYGDAEQGVLDLVDATRVSSNTAFAQLMLEVGPETVADLANRMGVSAELPAYNSLVLGTVEVSVLDMAVGYSTLANRGVHNDPTMISRIEQVDEDGDVTVVEQARPTGERVLTEKEADLVTYCLRQVVLGGTGSAANFGKAAAGKTGTTQKNVDAWFVGYTPKLTAAVWMGFPDKNPDPPEGDGKVPEMKAVHGIAVTGGSFPAQIWNKFMRNATADMDTGSFTAPKNFPGKVLNPRLELTTSTTSSTIPDESTSSTDPDSSTSSSSSSSSTSTTMPASTTTLPPCTQPATEDPRFPLGCDPTP